MTPTLSSAESKVALRDLEATSYGEFSERIYDQSYLAGALTHGQMELTFACPLKCEFCYCTCYTSQEHTRRELKTPEVIRILDEAAAAGCLWMTFSGGDPMLRPDFREIYDHAQLLGMIVTVFCSGQLLTPNWIEHFRTHPPFKIELPLYASDATTHERVSGTPRSFNHTLSNIRAALAAGIPLRIKSKITTLNTVGIEALRALIEDDLGLPFRPSYDLYPRLNSDPAPLALRLQPRELSNHQERYGREICDSNAQAASEATEGPNLSLFRCAAGVNTFYVNPYGSLVFCTFVRGAAYDLRSGTLQQGVAWLRAQLLNQTRTPESKCGSCKISSSCANCPGSAVLETGDMHQSTEYHCEVNHTVRGVERT
mgnify:CR=1 FL=1